jgi:hypothetical protein
MWDGRAIALPIASNAARFKALFGATVGHLAKFQVHRSRKKRAALWGDGRPAQRMAIGLLKGEGTIRRMPIPAWIS